MQKEEGKWLTKLSLVFLLFLIGYLFLKLEPIWKPVFEILFAVFIPFFIAAFITYLLHPIVEKLHHRGLPRAVAILLIYLLFIVGTGYGLYRGVPLLIAQLKELGDNIPGLIDIYRGWIDELYLQTSHLPHSFQTRIDQMLSGVEAFMNEQITHALNGFKKLLGSLFLIGIIPFLAFYLLKDDDLIKKTVWYLTPRKWRESGRRLLRDIDESLGGYIRGQLLVCLILGILAMIAFWFTGMSYPVLLGAIVGVTDLIPYFGPILGAVPALIIAATISFKMVITVAVVIFILQLLEGNLLSPLIVGKTLHMHPVLIIFSLLLGEQIGGVIGLILAVPFMAVFKVIVLHLRLHLIKD